LWAGLQAACVKIIKSGIPHCLNYCTNFTVQMQFTNVAVGHRLKRERETGKNFW